MWIVNGLLPGLNIFFLLLLTTASAQRRWHSVRRGTSESFQIANGSRFSSLLGAPPSRATFRPRAPPPGIRATKAQPSLARPGLALPVQVERTSPLNLQKRSSTHKRPLCSDDPHCVLQLFILIVLEGGNWQDWSLQRIDVCICLL